MGHQVFATKDEQQQPIPTAWRESLRKIVEAFSEGDLQLLKGVAGVKQISPADAEMMKKKIRNYGAHLCALPESSWDTSVCQWMGGYWDALVDLYTFEEGASDLVLAVRVLESVAGYEFYIQSIHVP